VLFKGVYLVQAHFSWLRVLPATGSYVNEFYENKLALLLMKKQLMEGNCKIVWLNIGLYWYWLCKVIYII
jgi:hypothetical protein